MTIMHRSATKRTKLPMKKYHNMDTLVQSVAKVKADQLDSLKKICILSENVIFHE